MMRRVYYQSRGKGWFGDSERHRKSALHVKTGNKRERGRESREQMAALQYEVQQNAPVSVPVSFSSEEPSVIASEGDESILNQDVVGVETVGQDSTMTSTDKLFRPSPPLFARKRRVWR